MITSHSWRKTTLVNRCYKCYEYCLGFVISNTLKLRKKEAIHIGFEKPCLNKQLYHVNLTLSFWSLSISAFILYRLCISLWISLARSTLMSIASLLSFTDFVFSLNLYFVIMYIPWHFHCLVTFKTLDPTFICKQAEDDYWYNRNMFLKNVVFFLKIL